MFTRVAVGRIAYLNLPLPQSDAAPSGHACQLLSLSWSVFATMRSPVRSRSRPPTWFILEGNRNLRSASESMLPSPSSSARLRKIVRYLCAAAALTLPLGAAILSPPPSHAQNHDQKKDNTMS